MTAFGLPNTLENMLTNLCQDNKLLSWNIRGGSEFIQVSIRFSPGTCGNDENVVKYKKMPPSQLRRDQMRAHKHSQSINSDEDNSNTNKNTIDNSNQSVLDNSSDSIVITSALTESMPNYSTEESQISQTTEEPITNSGLDVIQNKEVTEVPAATGKQYCSSPVVRRGNPALIGPDCTLCNESISGRAGSLWFRCTTCAGLDICKLCMDNGKHNCHKQQIQEYEKPVDVSMAHCYACGHVFSYRGYLYVYQCVKCEGYTMCYSCGSDKKLHKHHSKYMTIISARECIDSVRKLRR